MAAACMRLFCVCFLSLKRCEVEMFRKEVSHVWARGSNRVPVENLPFDEDVTIKLTCVTVGIKP